MRYRGCRVTRGSTRESPAIHPPPLPDLTRLIANRGDATSSGATGAQITVQSAHNYPPWRLVCPKCHYLAMPCEIKRDNCARGAVPENIGY